jgi:3'-5' exoribonuclease
MKKSHFVIDLSDGQAVASLFLVRVKEVRTSARTGSSWLQLELADRTGTISAKMWDNFTELAATFEQDDVVQVRGRVKLYKGEKELTLDQIVPALEREYELADFLPCTKYNIDELFGQLTGAIAGMKNPWLKWLLTDVVEDPAIAPRLRRAPAAMTMHHAFIGGLLEHVVSLIGLASGLAKHYPELDGDLLLTGVVLHDIGKLDELRYGRGIDYSDEGRLLGHISIGAGLVRDKIKNIAGFPPPLGTLVLHMILSHHGSYEFGSPALPQFPEAVALHFIDDLDSKMGAVRATLGDSDDAGVALWTERNPSLRRVLLRARQYLAANPVATAKATKPAAKEAEPAEPPAQKGLPLRA